MYFLASLFAMVFAFYIPGRFFLRHVETIRNQHVFHALSFLTGMFLWGAVSYLFGRLHIRNGIVVYLLFFLIWFLFTKQKFNISQLFRSIDVVALLIMFFGALTQALGVWFMGILTSRGIIGCCGHVPDNILFLAITHELTKRFPPNEPGLFGVELYDYHYLSHLFIAEFIRVFRLPLVATTYQFFSIMLSISLGLSAYVFAKAINANKTFLRWLLFFLYFGADAVFLFVLLLNTQFMFYFAAMESGAGFLFNYPRAFSIVGLLTGLSLFILWMRERKLLLFLAGVFILASLIHYKAYTGIFVWAGMMGVFLYSLFKKDIKLMAYAMATVLISIILFMPTVKGESGGFFFSGLWRVHDFFAMPELGVSHWLLAREVFLQHYNMPRVWLLDGVMFCIFVIVTYGSKIVGIIQTRASLRALSPALVLFFLFSMTSSFFVGMFYLQKLGGSTSVNFLITTVIAMSVFASLTMTYVVQRFPVIVSTLLSLFIISITLPRTLYVTYENMTKLSHVFITYHEAEFYKHAQKILPKHAFVLPIGYPFDYGQLYIFYMIDRPLYVLSSLNSEEAEAEEMKRRAMMNDIQYLKEQGVTHIVHRKSSETLLLKEDRLNTLIDEKCCALYEIQ